MADVSVGGGAKGGLYATSLTAGEANLATSLLTALTANKVEYYYGSHSKFTLNAPNGALILGDQHPHANATLKSDVAGGVLVGNQGADKYILSAYGSVVGGNGDNTVILRDSVGGSSLVSLGNGNDSVAITTAGGATVNLGDGNDSVSFKGPGLANLTLGNGSDTVSLSNGNVTVGNGADSISLTGSGSIQELGAGGADTINFGTGSVFVSVQGAATVFGADSMSAMMGPGGTLSQYKVGGHEVVSATGAVTVTGGAGEWLEGSNGAVLRAVFGGDTLQAISGDVRLVGTAGPHSVDDFVFQNALGGVVHDTVINFHTGDQIELDGVNVSQMLANTTHAGNWVSYGAAGATVHLSNGSTILLKGVTGLSSSDFTNHV